MSSREYNKKYYQNNKERLKQYQKDNPQSVEQRMFYHAKLRAKKRGLDFDIEISDIIVPEFCPITNCKLERNSKSGPAYSSPTLDRIDNSKGYIKGNIAVISWRANTSKSDLSVAEIKRMYEYVKGLE